MSLGTFKDKEKKSLKRKIFICKALNNNIRVPTYIKKINKKRKSKIKLNEKKMKNKSIKLQKGNGMHKSQIKILKKTNKRKYDSNY